VSGSIGRGGVDSELFREYLFGVLLKFGDPGIGRSQNRLPFPTVRHQPNLAVADNVQPNNRRTSVRASGISLGALGEVAAASPSYRLQGCGI